MPMPSEREKRVRFLFASLSLIDTHSTIYKFVTLVLYRAFLDLSRVLSPCMFAWRRPCDEASTKQAVPPKCKHDMTDQKTTSLLQRYKKLGADMARKQSNSCVLRLYTSQVPHKPFARALLILLPALIFVMISGKSSGMLSLCSAVST